MYGRMMTQMVQIKYNKDEGGTKIVRIKKKGVRNIVL
jgi:hypothetical protein